MGAVGGVFWYYGRELPDIDDAQDYQPRQTTQVYASTGELIAEWLGDDALARTVVPFDEIPQVMRDAMLAAEDAEFYQHPGIDSVGLLRAVVTNLRRGELTQGASTITQQVVKNLVLSPERSIRRKVQEALLAFRLEENLTKDEILSIYLNEIFFGVRYYGVEAAAQYYFGHSVRDVTLEEAAVLAGLVQSPNRYNPYRHPDRALARRAYVLRNMYDKGFIEESVYRAADAAPLTLVDPELRTPWVDAFPYFADAVRRELLESFSQEQVFGGGLQVHTTLDIPSQLAAEDAVRNGLIAFDARHGFHRPFESLEGADAIDRWRAQNNPDSLQVGLAPDQVYRAVVLASDDVATEMAIGPATVRLRRTPEARVRPGESSWSELFPVGAVFSVEVDAAVAPALLSDADPANVEVDLLDSAQAAAVLLDIDTRAIRALVGGFDFTESPFNRAIQARRQVGSTFKPVVYAAAIEARVATPATVYADQPVTFPMPNQQTWSPQNYDGEFEGPMTLRTALARSRNVIAVRVLDQLGVGRASEFAARLGVTENVPQNLTLALGSMELSPLEAANVFAAFPSGGLHGEPFVVAEVRNSTGDVLLAHTATPQRAMDESVAWLTTSMMRSVVESGTASRAGRLERQLGGKTGTTNSVRDAWFIGFSPIQIAAVWVGRDDNEPLGRGESGSSTALPVWIDLFDEPLQAHPVAEFALPPAGVTSMLVDPMTGLRAAAGAPGAYTEYFIEGTEPREWAPTGAARSVNQVLQGGAVEDGSGTGDAVFDGF